MGATGKFFNMWMENNSAIKRYELSSHAETMMTLKCILVSAQNQSEKVKYCMLPILWHSPKNKTVRAGRQISGYQGFGGMGRFE